MRIAVAGDYVTGLSPADILPAVTRTVTLQFAAKAVQAGAFIGWTQANCDNPAALIGRQEIAAAEVAVSFPTEGLYQLCYSLDDQYYVMQTAATMTVSTRMFVSQTHA
jgi:hypothetical protein